MVLSYYYGTFSYRLTALRNGNTRIQTLHASYHLTHTDSGRFVYPAVKVTFGIGKETQCQVQDRNLYVNKSYDQIANHV
jgi:hypothetical protein